MMNEKVHFKLYKSGKKWLVAAIGVATLSVGLSQAPGVKADTVSEGQSSADSSQTTSSSSSSNVQVLKTKSQTPTTKTDVTSLDADDANVTKESSAVTTTSNASQTSQSSENTTTSKSNSSSDDAPVTNSSHNTSSVTSASDASQASQSSDSTTTPKSSSGTGETPATSSNSSSTRSVTTQTNDSSSTTSGNQPDGSTNLKSSVRMMRAVAESTSVDSTTTTSAVPAIANDPNSVSKTTNKSVDATIQLEATNGNGTTISSKSTDTNPNIIINTDTTNLSAVLTVSNLTDQTQSNVTVQFTFPRYNNPSAAPGSQTVVSPNVAEDTLTKGLPTGLAMSFAMSNGNYQTLDQLKASGTIDWSKLVAIQLNGTLAPDESYVLSLPLKMKQVDTTNSSTAEAIGSYNYVGEFSFSSLAYRYATPIALTGQYRAVTLVKAGTNTTAAEYQAVPAELQALMPEVQASDLTITNVFGNAKTQTSGSTLYPGGTVKVDLYKTNISATLAKYGYTLNVVNGGYIDNTPTFSADTLTPTVDGDNGTGTYAPVIYLVVRKVLTVADNSVSAEAGSSWTAGEGVSAIGNDNQPLTDASAITTNIDDPDGILQNGKLVKNGSFTVTYSLRSGLSTTAVTVSQTQTVTVDGAYTLNFVNKRGDTVVTTTVFKQDGNQQTVDLPTGYSLSNGATTTTVNLNANETVPITINVVPIPVAYTVNFVNAQGQTVGTTSPVGIYQDTVNVADAVPTGYQLASTASATVTLPASATTTIDVPVVPAPVQYTVHYVDSTGNVVGTTTIAGVNGQQIDLSNQLPSGYQLVSGMMGKVTLTPNPTSAVEIQVVKTGSEETLADAKTPIPAITNDTNTTLQNQSSAVEATAQLMATNGQGTSLSESSDYTGAGAIIDAGATNIAAVYRLANRTNQTQTNISVYFTLPKYEKDATSQTVVSDEMSEADFIKDLPVGLHVNYGIHNGELLSYADLIQKYPNFKWSDLIEVQVLGQLAANEAYTWTIPLTALKQDTVNKSGVERLEVYSFNGGPTGTGDHGKLGDLPFRYGKSINVNMQGQYSAVTQIVSNVYYVQVPQNIQNLMPYVKAGDVTYHNFYRYTGEGNANLYSGGIIAVDLEKTGIADIVKDKGYSLLLNADGTPQSMYSYRDYGSSHTVTAEGNGSGTEAGSSYAPYMYITLRKVVTAKDTTIKVGQNWNHYVGLASVIDNNDKLLANDQYANLVNFKISDPDNVLKDGKPVKTGKFTITYSYKVADDYYGTGKPYIISDTATITVNGDYVVNFVDPADPNTVLATTTLTDQMVNGTVDVTKFKPTSYDFVQGENGSVTLSNDPSTPITLNVVKTAKQYTVNYVTADGTALKTVTATGSLAEQLDLSTDKPADYSLVDPTSADVTLTEASVQTFNVPVEKTQHSYTIQINDVDGINLSTVMLDGTNGETVDLTKNIPADYQLATGYSASVTLNDPETTKVIKVERVSKTYTVNFVNAQNQTVKTVTFSGKTGEQLSVAKDVPTDYQLATGVTGQLTLAQDASIPMVVNVDRLQKTYTVNFVDAQNQIIKTVTFSGTTGENKDVTADIPADYQLATGATAKFTLVQDASVPMVVNIDRLQKTYTVNFVNAQSQIIKTVTFSGTTGENKDVTADIPADYQLATGATTKFTLVQDASVPMVVNVDRLQKTYTVNFVDAQNETIKTVTFTGKTGEQLSVAKDVPTDYQLATGVTGQLTLAQDAKVPMTVSVDRLQKVYTVNFVNDQQQVVKTMTLSGTTGQEVNVTDGIPADYQLATGAIAKFTLVQDASVPMVVNVDRLQKTYTVNFVDAQNQTVKTVTFSGKTGEQLSVAKDVPTDYQLAAGVTGQLTLAQDAKVPMTVSVDRLQKVYTVNFVNDQQQVVKTMTLSGTTGQEVNVTDGIPADYQLATGAIAKFTLVQDASVPMVVNVDRLQKTYTVNFVDAQNQIIKTVTFSGTTGENKDVTADIPAGYQLAAGVSAQLTLAMDATKPMTIQPSAKSAASQGSQATSNSSTASQPSSVASQATSDSSTASQPSSVASQATSDASTASQPSSVASQATSDQSTASQPSSVASQATSDASTASQPSSVASQATSDALTVSQPSSVASQATGNLVTTSQACPVTSDQPMVVSHQANLQGLQVSRREIMPSGSAQPQNASQVSSQTQRAVSVKAAQAAVITKSSTKSQAQPATARQRAMGLPQTDERASSLAVSLGLTALVGLLGLAGLAKKERR